MRPKYTQETIDKAIGLYKTGMSVAEIAEKCDCCYSSVVKWAKSAGMRQRTRVYSPDERRKIVARALFNIENGIEEELGVPRTTLARWLPAGAKKRASVLHERPKCDMSYDEEMAAVERYEKGETIESLADSFEQDALVMRNILRWNGARLRRKK